MNPRFTYTCLLLLGVAVLGHSSAFSATAQPQNIQKDTAGNVTAGFNSSQSHVFNSGSSVTFNGTMAGAPTGGTLDLSLLSLTLPPAFTRNADFDTPAERYSLGFRPTTNGSPATLVDLGNMGASATLNFANATDFKGVLTANVTITISNLSPSSTQSAGGTIRFKQDATGGRTVTWPAEVVNSADITIDPAANAVTVVGLVAFGDGDFYAFSSKESSSGATNLGHSETSTTVTVTSDTGTDATLPAATTSNAGVLTASDKTKLDGIASGAQVNPSIASQAEAEAGTENTKMMTPLRVSQAIDALASGGSGLPTNSIILWPTASLGSLPSGFLEADGTEGTVDLSSASSALSVATYIQKTNGVAPTLSSATIGTNGTTFTMVFSETVDFGAGGNGGFVPTLTGGAATLSYSSGSGSDTLVYTLSRTVIDTETGTLAYTQPGDGVEDAINLDLASFSGNTIDNGSEQPGGGFSPPTGTFAWYKADALSLSNSDPVGSWTDSSGSGNTVSESTNKPTYLTNLQNGLPGVRFDGADDVLQSAAFGAAETQPNTVHMVVASKNLTEEAYFADGSSSGRQLVYLGSDTGLHGYAGSFLHTSTGVLTDTAAHQLTVVFDGASSAIYLDGSLLASGDVGSASMGGVTLGATGDLGGFGQVDIFEVLWRAGGRDTATETYLKSKWATP